MCRNIRTLYHLQPPASEEEIRAAALQYVRKISGYQKPSKANEAAFQAAIEAVAAASASLLASLETGAPLRARRAGGGAFRLRTAPERPGRAETGVRPKGKVTL